MAADLAKPAAHTPSPAGAPQQVAAASQSGRVVLLHGSTCSGKTQLVMELARLTRWPLVIVPLTAETGEMAWCHVTGRNL